jgi:hypothetical protein
VVGTADDSTAPRLNAPAEEGCGYSCVSLRANRANREEQREEEEEEMVLT